MRDRLTLLELVRSLRLRAQVSRPEDWAWGERQTALDRLSSEIVSCRGCQLAATRIKAVPGVGSPEAQVVFVGEGPGYEEDRKGEPFVGKAGQLLDRILKAMGLSRESVFIANIVKCHPMKDPSTPEARGNDRPPSPEEIAACRGFVERQIAAIAPRVIVCLGAVSAKALLGTTEPLSRIRGRWAEFRRPGGSGAPIPVMPTYHPAALLRDEALKGAVWSDMKAVLAALGREAPGAGVLRPPGASALKEGAQTRR
ncbi:MAG: uracil-DNA glycosylase [Elusimicrobia bacterium]|nr:uracil-DNA glycosylase [Elusimicrobiota bacterium]